MSGPIVFVALIGFLVGIVGFCVFDQQSSCDVKKSAALASGTENNYAKDA